MKRLILATVMVCSTGTMALGAQGPGRRYQGPMPGGAMGGGPGGGDALGNPAEFLLSQTGELKLTDAQVTRLAAIARRSADRRRALRAQLDSIRPEMRPGERPDSATRARMRQQFDQMRPTMERLREQSQTDRRDAIAVLTADQQAQAWERIARVGRARAGGGRGFGAPGRNGFRERPMPRPGMRRQGIAPGRMGPPDDGGAPGEPRRMGPRPRPDETAFDR